eukprot:2316508-Pyramimonas_sp.AAC.1
MGVFRAHINLGAAGDDASCGWTKTFNQVSWVFCVLCGARDAANARGEACSEAIVRRERAVGCHHIVNDIALPRTALGGAAETTSFSRGLTSGRAGSERASGSR